MDPPGAQLTQRSLQAEFVVFGDDVLLPDFEASAQRAEAGRTKIIAASAGNDVIQKAVATAAELDEKHDATVFERIVPAVARGDMEAAREGGEPRGATSSGRCILALGVGIALSLLPTRVVARPILAIKARLAEIADGDGDGDGDGDLTQRVDESRDDEIGRLRGAFNRFVSQIQDTCRRVVTATESLGATARQMAAPKRSRPRAPRPARRWRTSAARRAT